jgi:uncharacterized membrane protein
MEKQYYIASGKDHLGPFTLSQMKDKKLTPETLIWYEGLAQWTKAEDLEELKRDIPVIISPPLTPTQVEIIEKRVKELILRKLLGNAAKNAGTMFLIVFVVYAIIQYIILSNEETRLSYKVYATDDDVFSLAIISALTMAILISLIALPIFYFIENQKPYSGLLTCKDKTEGEIYQELVKRQEEKYVYKEKLNSTLFIIGCVILGLNLIFGFFPEYKVFQEEDIIGFDRESTIEIVFVAIVIRIVALLVLLHQIENKNRSYLWLIFVVIFPAIGFMIIGSLYPIRKENADKVVDKGEGYLCASGSVERTQESHEEEIN